MSRICGKCNESIPASIMIDGIRKPTRSTRKNCYICVPPKTMTNGLECDAKREHNLQRWRRCHSKRRKEMAEKCVLYKGGECEICGYSKCRRALDFHHRNPEEKKFGISYGGDYKSWEVMKIELDKCILVCSNCHREIEDGITICP